MDLEKESKLYLLLVGTLQPHASVKSGMTVIDPAYRLKEYQRSVNYYAKTHGSAFDGILFAENSGADLTAFGPEVRGKIGFEAINVPPPPDSATLGRGLFETQMVKDAFSYSAMLRENPDARVLKVTGRYIVHNISRVAAGVDPASSLSFNVRKYPHAWADMWLYGANSTGIRRLLGELTDATSNPDLVPAELILPAVLDRLWSDGLVVQRRFPVEPFISGRRGWDGRSYDSPAQRAKWMVRSVSRRILPALWI